MEDIPRYQTQRNRCTRSRFVGVRNGALYRALDGRLARIHPLWDLAPRWPLDAEPNCLFAVKTVRPGTTTQAAICNDLATHPFPMAT